MITPTQLTEPRRGITAEQIASKLGITERAVRKKEGLDNFLIGLRWSGEGRPAKEYREDVFTLWPEKNVALPDRSNTRQVRRDLGVARKGDWEFRELVIRRVQEYFMANAQINLLAACPGRTGILQRKHRGVSAGAREPHDQPEGPWVGWRTGRRASPCRWGTRRDSGRRENRHAGSRCDSW